MAYDRRGVNLVKHLDRGIGIDHRVQNVSKWLPPTH
jgi:hypothetical protein